MSLVNILIVLGIIALVVWLLGKFMKQFKQMNVDHYIQINGGVKSGKSTIAVYLALIRYNLAKFNIKFINFFRRIFKKELLEEPLLYSNVPLAVDYVPLTKELLMHEERFRFKSVIYIQEASLLADSRLIKDDEVNLKLLIFNKLIGHELHGGTIIYDTHTIGDLHYSIKRCTNQYYYIHHLSKWIPFFLIAYVREERYSGGESDNTVINVNNSDVADTLKRVIIPKSIWKKFDAYCYSYLTDNLPVADDVVKGANLPDLKVRSLLSFRPDINGLTCDESKTKK